MGVANVLHYAFPSIPKAFGFSNGTPNWQRLPTASQVSDSRIVVISSVAGVVGVPFRTLRLGGKKNNGGRGGGFKMATKEFNGHNMSNHEKSPHVANRYQKVAKPS